MKIFFKYFVVFSAVYLLSGCANQYKQFYRPAGSSDSIQRTYANREHAPLPNPVVERISSSETSSVVDRYARRGYSFIGHSSFNSARQESLDSAVSLGKELQADLIVVMDPKYTGSQTTSVPITTPTTSTSFSSGTATAYGPRGVVNAYGSGMTTTYGSVTNLVPVTVDRMDYSAVFFIKMKVRFGAFFRDLNDEERQKIQSNKGAVIRLIVDGSPAFREDLLAGDIISNVNGHQIENTGTLMKILEAERGNQLSVTLVRSGTYINKTLPPTN